MKTKISGSEEFLLTFVRFCYQLHFLYSWDVLLNFFDYLVNKNVMILKRSSFHLENLGKYNIFNIRVSSF